MYIYIIYNYIIYCIYVMRDIYIIIYIYIYTYTQNHQCRVAGNIPCGFWLYTLFQLEKKHGLKDNTPSAEPERQHL